MNFSSIVRTVIPFFRKPAKAKVQAIAGAACCDCCGENCCCEKCCCKGEDCGGCCCCKG